MYGGIVLAILLECLPLGGEGFDKVSMRSLPIVPVDYKSDTEGRGAKWIATASALPLPNKVAAHLLEDLAEEFTPPAPVVPSRRTQKVDFYWNVCCPDIFIDMAEPWETFGVKSCRGECSLDFPDCPCRKKARKRPTLTYQWRICCRDSFFDVTRSWDAWDIWVEERVSSEKIKFSFWNRSFR